jgi:sugar transferase (PEP-CTERM system associated)
MARVRVFKSYLKTPFIILLALEFSLALTSLFSATWLRFINNPEDARQILDRVWFDAPPFAVICSLSMLATGLYQGQIREGMAGIILRLLISLIAVGLLLSLLFYLFPDFYLGRAILLLALMQCFFVFGTIRALFFELVDKETFKKKVLVYGAGITAHFIDQKLRRKSDRRSFSIVGYILLKHQFQKQAVDDSKIIDPGESLYSFADENDVEEIIVATSDVKAQIPVNDLLECKLKGIYVIDIITFFEREVGQVRIDILDPRWLIFSEGFFQSRLKSFTKRLFDICASFIILLAALPALVLAILAIWFEDGFNAPIFYHQTRVGKNGKPYRVYKLRSMNTDAEKSGAVWASQQDSRVTKVGAVTRKTRIDEIPQIFNVLNGTMSFVGPRPERPEFVEKLAKEVPYYQDRHLVKPGITGWAQLKYPYGSSVTDSYQKQLYDMYYIKNHSLFLDFLILLQTVEVVLFGKGAR